MFLENIKKTRVIYFTKLLNGRNFKDADFYNLKEKEDEKNEKLESLLAKISEA
jgi:hypothetical protein